MIPAFRRVLVALALCLPCISPTLAADAAPTAAEAHVEAAALAAQAAVQLGPREIVLGDQGVLKLPEGFGFIPKEEAQALMIAQGNKNVGKGLHGLVVSPDLAGFVAVEFTPAGYVKDEEARDWNADELLTNLKEGTEAANAERRTRGLP